MPRRIETIKGVPKEKRLARAWNLSNLKEHVAKTSEEEMPSAEMEFLRKYQEIWAPPPPPRPPMRSLELPSSHNEQSSSDVREAAINHDMLDEREVRLEDPKSEEEDGSHSSGREQMQYLAEYYDEVKMRQWTLQSHLLRQVKRLDLKIGRPKYLRLPCTSEGWIGKFSLFWNTSFALLDLQNDKYLKSNSVDTKILESPNRPMQRLSNWFSEQCTTLSAAERFWQSQDASLRLAVWPELMIHALTSHPSKALRFLVATYSRPYPPSYAVADSIEYILRKHIRHLNPEDSVVTQSIYRWILRLLSRGPEERKDYLNLTQDSIYMLLTRVHPSHLKTFYKTLEEHSQPLGRHILMQFASAFGKSGQVNMAMEVLKRMKAENLNFRLPEMASICTTILQRAHRLEEGESAPSDLALFDFMLECGMEPNVAHYNVLMHNTFKAGHHELGWQIFDSMTAHGVEPQAHTYSILINDAKKRNDRASIHQIWTDIQAKGIRNGHIITDLLHSMLLLDKEKRPVGIKNIPGKDTTFGVMLSFYCMYFRLEPLAHVAPVYMDSWPDLPRSNQPNSTPANPENDSAHSTIAASIEARPSVPISSGSHLLEPEYATLLVMMTALVRDLPKPPLDHRPYESRPYATRPYTLRFYEHFHNLVLAGDPIATHLVRESGDRVYNLAIMGLGRVHETLHFCTEVIGIMLSHSQEVSHEKGSPTAGQYDQKPPVFKPASISSTQMRIMPPKPTVRTWTILLKCFLDRNQPRAAEKVLQMMTSRGIKPDRITWHCLVLGYSRMQNIDKAVDAVDRMAYAGFELDERITKSLRWLKDRQAVVKAFSKAERTRRWAEKFDPKLIAARKYLELDGTVMQPLKEMLDLDLAEPGWDTSAKEEDYLLDDIIVMDQYKNSESCKDIWELLQETEHVPPVRHMPVVFKDRIIKLNTHLHQNIKKRKQRVKRNAPLVSKDPKNNNVKRGIVVQWKVSKKVRVPRSKFRRAAVMCLRLHPSFKRIGLDKERLPIVVSDEMDIHSENGAYEEPRTTSSSS